MYVDANAGTIKIDQMKKEIIDLDFTINKIDRLNTICEANNQRGTELDTDLNPVRQEVERKESEQAEYNQKVQDYKNRLDERQKQIENSENDLNKRESDINQLEEQAENLQKQLNTLITRYDRLYQGFTVDQATKLI